MRAVIPSQKIAIESDFVRIVKIVVEQKAQNIGPPGLDHTPQLVRGESIVTRESDFADARAFTFADFIDEVDASLLIVDRFRHDTRIEAPAPMIELKHDLDVIVHQSSRQ